jgi:hypothetical protein
MLVYPRTWPKALESLRLKKRTVRVDRDWRLKGRPANVLECYLLSDGREPRRSASPTPPHNLGQERRQRRKGQHAGKSE